MPLGYDVPSARQRHAARPPLGGGCRRRRLGERNCRAISLPPSALHAATSLAEGGKGKRIPTPVSALARNDRGTGRTGSSAPTEQNKSRAETGRRTPRAFVPLRSTAGRRPLRNDRGTGWTGSFAPTMRDVEDAVPYGVTGERGGQGRLPLQCATGAPQWTKVSAAQLRTLLYISAGGESLLIALDHGLESRQAALDHVVGHAVAQAEVAGAAEAVGGHHQQVVL